MALHTITPAADLVWFRLDTVSTATDKWAVEYNFTALVNNVDLYLADQGANQTPGHADATTYGVGVDGDSTIAGVATPLAAPTIALGDRVRMIYDGTALTLTFQYITSGAPDLVITNVPTGLRPYVAFDDDSGVDTVSISADTSIIPAPALAADVAGWGDTVFSNVPGVAGSRTIVTVEDGLTSTQVDILGYNDFDSGNNPITIPDVIGTPTTVGTFAPPADHTYVHILTPNENEVRVTALGVTNITNTKDAYNELTEVADAAVSVGDDLTAIDVSIAATYNEVTTTPGGYTQTNTAHAQVVTTSQQSAISCIDRQIEVAQWVESNEERMQAVFITNDINALDSAVTTDIGASLRGLGLNRSAVIFSPVAVQLVDQLKDISTERPDAALLGTLATTQEGARQFDYQNVVNVTDSWLSESQQQNLKAKGYNFVETFKRTTFTHIFRGRTVTDREMRIQWGADFLDISIETSLANYAFSNDLMAFDEETFADVEAIIYQWKQVALDRRIIVDTKLRPSTITLPDPDSFSATDRASGIANIQNAYCWALNSAIDEWVIRGEIKIFAQPLT